MNALKGKKLLILGGNVISGDIVKTAQNMGVYTIVTDWNDTKKSPAKLVSNEYWNISLTDYDQLLEKIKEEGVDGIITGFTDSYLLPYQRLCELADLPCYSTKEIFEMTTNKDAFKRLCVEYNLQVVPQYDLKSLDKLDISPQNKIIIKPVDNSGSRGICLCENRNEIKEKLEYSLSFSSGKKVVVERYMDCDDVSLEYLIQDGEVMLSSMCDRYIYRTKFGGSVTSGLVYPSVYLNGYVEKVDKKVKDMFKGIGMKNGVLFMQAFVQDGNFYFYEMGYRLSGGRHYIFTKNQNGIAASETLVHFALTGKMSDSRLSEYVTPYYEDICCQLAVLCKSDTIYMIDGLDIIRELPGVIDVLCAYKEGDVVGNEGTTAQIFAKVHIVSRDKFTLKTVLQEIRESLVVKNRRGENMVQDFFFTDL